MLNDQKDLLSEFNANGVEYLVIGGHAVNAYGIPRMTKDLDVLIRPTLENSREVLRALASFGASLEGTTADDLCDLETILQLGVEPSRIDILQTIPGISFDQAWANRTTGVIDETLSAPFISREDLITNKLASGRPQDLADVDHLRRAASAETQRIEDVTKL